MPDGSAWEAKWELKPGERILRKELHKRYGARPQGGITPSRVTPNVFLFTQPDVGEEFGYVDGWDGETFLYTGEGQVGDQEMRAGNRAIRDHVHDGRALRLFKGSSGEVEYVGEFAYAGHDWITRPDREGRPRKALRFRLRPLDPQVQRVHGVRSSGSTDSESTPLNRSETTPVRESYQRIPNPVETSDKSAVMRSRVMKLHADEVSVEKLLQDGPYIVPRFQRPYAWGVEQIDELWADATANAPVDGHFMGSIVLAPESAGSGGPLQIIDGQQRIATIAMLLAILRDEAYNLGEGTLVSKIEQLLRYQGFSAGDFEFRIKLGDANDRLFRDGILRHPQEPQRISLDKRHLSPAERARNKALLAAHARLTGLVKAQIASVPNPKAEVDALTTAMVTGLHFVKITVESLADAFLLFETLNDRGLALSAADLLKSHILQRIAATTKDDQEQVHKAADRWDGIVDRLGGGDITRFLRHYLLLRREKVRKADIYPAFKDLVSELGPHPVLDEIEEMSEIYAQLLTPSLAESEAVERALAWLVDLPVVTHNVLLMPAVRWLPEPQLLSLLRVVEALSFRWTVSGLNAQVLESTYQRAASELHKTQGNAMEYVLEQLLRAMPEDDQFRSQFETQRLGTKKVARYVLSRLEWALTPTGELDIKPWMDVHLEHIIPQTHTDYWMSRVDPEEFDYDDIVQRWGNLALLHGKPNQSVSNGVWKVKRAAYAESMLKLTRSLAYCDEWTAHHVIRRQAWMARLASYVWSEHGVTDNVPHDVRIPDFCAQPDDLEPLT